MSCPEQRVWAAYLDEALPRSERTALAAHLAGCSECSALTLELRQESALLTSVLEDATERDEPASVTAPAIGAALGVLAAAVIGLHSLSDWLSGLGRDSAPGLVDLRGLAVQLLVDSVLYLFREGASMLETMASTFGIVVLLLLGGLLVLSVRRRSHGAIAVGLLLVALAAPAAALELRGGHADHATVTVGAGEVLDDSLAAGGELVNVDGTVNGNLYTGARRVVVRGTVKGDLFAGGERVEIEGAVDGNVMFVGDTLVVRGVVGRNLHAGAGTVRIESSGRVDGDLMGFGREIEQSGRVGRDLMAFGGQVLIRGEVARNVRTGTGRLHLESPAKIGGDLTAYVGHATDLQIDPGAVVAGKTDRHVRPKEKSRYLKPGFYVWRLIWLAAAFVTGMILQRLLPWLFPTRVPDAGALLRAAGVGFLAFVAVPAAAVLLMLTLVGLPIGLIALGLWLALLYLAQLPVATLVGRGLLQRPDQPPVPLALVLLAGLVFLALVTHLPYVGGIASLVVFLVGFGLAVLGAKRATS